MLAGPKQEQWVPEYHPQPFAQDETIKEIKILPNDQEIRPHINVNAVINPSKTAKNIKTQVRNLQLPSDGTEKEVRQLLEKDNWINERE